MLNFVVQLLNSKLRLTSYMSSQNSSQYVTYVPEKGHLEVYLFIYINLESFYISSNLAKQRTWE